MGPPASRMRWVARSGDPSSGTSPEVAPRRLRRRVECRCWAWAPERPILGNLVFIAMPPKTLSTPEGFALKARFPGGVVTSVRVAVGAGPTPAAS